jgi:hypothetical protein
MDCFRGSFLHPNACYLHGLKAAVVDSDSVGSDWEVEYLKES